jgi:hypothetical protein
VDLATHARAERAVHELVTLQGALALELTASKCVSSGELTRTCAPGSPASIND